MNTHIIAIATYGSHRVKHPHTGQMVSAHKLGYTSAASAVLLALMVIRHKMFPQNTRATTTCTFTLKLRCGMATSC